MENYPHVNSVGPQFLQFSSEDADALEVRYEDGTLWLTQRQMAALFDVDVRTISEHIINIYNEEELTQKATIRNFRIVQTEGTRQVKRDVKHYNLDAIIAVGFRVNSARAIQFRQWAIQVIRRFTLQGYVIDRDRMEAGRFIEEDYFERLLEEVREIRLSERRFYQKITDIYATAIDYTANSPTTRKFFATVQNKMHFAVHGHTAAELSRLVSAYLDLAESRAKRGIPTTMAQWVEFLDAVLTLDMRQLLTNAGQISQQVANLRALKEYNRYRVIQDQDQDRD